ncbi:hypothetical protein KSS87_000016 [Heliosperma pusillum]|nr:hypothetical protein KSS87_000016 [Heliosperma pusillum]
MAIKLVNFVTVFAFIVTLFLHVSDAQLSPKFYSSTCPNLQNIVLNTMKQAVNKEQRMAASILRLHFHDCFVNGCDGSILLDTTTAFMTEKEAFANRNGSARGFEVIDAIKANVEASCKATVSCADILTLAARDGIVLLGGPSWDVPLGRRDSTTASQALANANLPPPTSDLSNLQTLFVNNQGLSLQEMTTLSGAHTIGQARCTNFRAHIYNDTNIDPTFAATRRSNCPLPAGNGDNNLAPLDLKTPIKFDNNYYINLVAKRGLLHSDQVLFNGGSQDAQVKSYSNNNAAFFKDFVAAMIKMGNLNPLTGSNGEIRLNCHLPN